MVYLAVVQAVALAGVVALAAALARSLRAQGRAHGRREDALLDRIMHLCEKPWNEAPAATNDWRERADEAIAWTASPEQHPLD